ncbi:TetR family transcriptional regulator [Chelativorans salis]|uniref:TetR family transcriptional regulator n=1 Tax=Chelativorans salis TaxID=2978478 RepID=A0ABT2LRM5_9HYPH|nr:TetR family transcriptional regulator [Chelativorans sp. EGI FJ00035]MCT7377011.1 TetR family transcriptional regulator [Chelativorans sp. EGI FJ00035]
MSRTSSSASTRSALPAEAQAPRTRDPVRTRAAILAAARAEFSERGLEGARIDAIAARAATNKRMLYHYFGNKDALYCAVLEEAYREIREGERALQLDQYEPVEAVERLVRFTFRHFLECPWFIALLTNENLMKARYLRTLPEMHGLHSPLVDQLRKLIHRGGESGAFRADIDPVQLYISIAALGYFYVSNNATLSVIFDTDLASSAHIASREAHAVEMVLDHLRVKA